ncbi:hypothetical protein Micbo1qcDRAFT_162045 [Microdochium bolleyi]|uniref:Sec20 C-terminal domain-containing protein n=1 Tax=Microdochium bolleyi TaxID=196109 RepID=A0A136J474_9PEZI|nr:hypothetical protein Micbo1qcDRAFT_162045 [Microdochium bolleyi]
MSAEALEKRYTDLQDRLVSLQDATSQLQELIDRLANFNFQPGSVPLGSAQAGSADDDNNVSTELSSEINQILQEQEEDLELLLEEIVDLRTGGRPGMVSSGRQHDKERLQDGAKRLSVELQSCRKYFRKAQIAAKQNLELARRQEREILWSSYARPRSGATSPGMGDSQTLQPPSSQQQQLRTKTKKRSEMTKDEQTISASNDVTQTLRQTYDLMASELSRSEFAHKTLQESTAALAQLNDSYSNLDTLLATSKDLLGTLWRSQKTDTWYLETAFYVLGVTIAWLVFRRWLYGPMWWLVWLPLKLVFRTGMGVSRAVSRSGDGKAGDTSSLSGAVDGSQMPPGVVMNNKDVPTIRVGDDEQVVAGAVDDESMIEKVEQIIAESERNGGGPYGDDLGGEDGEGIILDDGGDADARYHNERVRAEL